MPFLIFSNLTSFFTSQDHYEVTTPRTSLYDFYTHAAVALVTMMVTLLGRHVVIDMTGLANVNEASSCFPKSGP